MRRTFEFLGSFYQELIIEISLMFYVLAFCEDYVYVRQLIIHIFYIIDI